MRFVFLLRVPSPKKSHRKRTPCATFGLVLRLQVKSAEGQTVHVLLLTSFRWLSSRALLVGSMNSWLDAFSSKYIRFVVARFCTHQLQLSIWAERGSGGPISFCIGRISENNMTARSSSRRHEGRAGHNPFVVAGAANKGWPASGRGDMQRLWPVHFMPMQSTSCRCPRFL